MNFCDSLRQMSFQRANYNLLCIKSIDSIFCALTWIWRFSISALMQCSFLKLCICLKVNFHVPGDVIYTSKKSYSYQSYSDERDIGILTSLAYKLYMVILVFWLLAFYFFSMFLWKKKYSMYLGIKKEGNYPPTVFPKHKRPSEELGVTSEL